MPTDDPFTEEFLRSMEASDLDDSTVRQLEKLSPEHREELAKVLKGRAEKRYSAN